MPLIAPACCRCEANIQAMIMSEKIKPGEPEAAAAGVPPDQVPDWLSNRLRRMFTDVMDEPVPDDFKALLRKLEEKERGS